MIKVENLFYKQGNSTILDDINFTIETGEFVSIIGPNGAGKSTLIKIILNLLDNYQGSVFIDNQINHKWLKKKSIGYVPQKEVIDYSFPATVLDIVKLGALKKKFFFTKNDTKIARETLEFVGLSGFEKRLIGELSGGEFQKVLLARSIANGSEYLFFDEPESNIDFLGVSKFYEILKKINLSGKTIVVISHDIHLVAKYSTKILCLNKKLHCHNSPENITTDILTKTFGNIISIMEKHNV